MTPDTEEGSTLLRSALSRIQNITTFEELESLSIELLGRNGSVNDLFKKITSVPADKKKAFGKQINDIKLQITTALESKKAALQNKSESEEKVDITLPGREYPTGSQHISATAIEEISEIFEKVGFTRVFYPEIEWEYYAFEALNMPSDHPARDDFETFFIDAVPDSRLGRMVLTPHTSNGQVREMLRLGSQPPIQMINIGKTYRPNWDATHVPMFHQFEGLVVDTDITIAHLRGAIEYFVHAFFGTERNVRLRPFHFQFTEPSFEVDISCDNCGGSGKRADGSKCPTCKSGWVELGGSGMVHPNVLKAGGIDPEIYSGWAFGFGVERVFMMKQGLKLPDLRLTYSNDIRFLEQF